jgi:hypothetical protein
LYIVEVPAKKLDTKAWRCLFLVCRYTCMTIALRIGMRSKGDDTDIVKEYYIPILRARHPHLSKKGIP